MTNTTYYFQHPDVNQTEEFFTSYTSNVTDGMWGPSLIGMIFMMTFLALMTRYPVDKSFAASSFVTMIGTVMLAGLGVVGTVEIIAALMLLLLGIVIGGGDRSV